MLLKRLITAALLGPLVIMGVLLSNQNQFVGALIVILIIASWEFCSLIKIKSIAGKAAFIMLAIAITYFFKKRTLDPETSFNCLVTLVDYCIILDPYFSKA